MAWLILGLQPPAHAQVQPSATLDQFAAAETPEDDFAVSRPTDLGHLRLGAQLHLDYGLNPLVYEGMLGDASTERLSVVEHQLVATVGLSFGLFDRLVVFAGLPVNLLMTGADEAQVRAVGGEPADGSGFGDTVVGVRGRIFGEADDPVALGAQATLTLPTAGVPNDPFYRGERSVTFLPELLLEVRPGADSRIDLNVGARIREEDAPGLSNIRYLNQLTFAVGFGIPVWTDEADDRTHLDVTAQVYGATAFEDFFGRESTPFEGTAGARFHHASGAVGGLAVGAGFNRGFGSPDLRLVAMGGWALPEEREPAPLAGPTDRDGDGLTDDVDQCPDDPEDADQFQDEDGCPDPDNDQDGILDVDDRCPMEPETQNEFEDEDGCPDVGDRDGDGLRDDVDRCPDEPEDVDSFEDEDGCPDADNDEDTVLDPVDNCPLEPGLPEHHGCQAPQRVAIRSERLEILEKIYFRTDSAEIRERSFPLLANVAQVLNAHPEIRRVRVEGHTDSRGTREHNMRLSQARAEAVVRHLVEVGHVDPERLEARGFGPDRPVVPNARTREEHARNRRVEFHIVGETEGRIQMQDNGPDAGAVDR